MALTSRDETDLLLPLMEGASETLPFATFLERLRRRTRAVAASLTIQRSGDRAPISLFAGPDVRKLAHDLQLEELNLTDRIQYDRLRPGRVYSGDEFDDHDPMRKARRARDMRQLGLADERVVRLLDEDEASVWLIIASARACTAADSALLSALAPYAAAALRTYITRERDRLAAALDGEGLHRAGAGWIVFDKAARMLAIAPATADLLTGVHGQPLSAGQRPRAFGPAIERALADAAAAFAQDPAAPARTLVLCAEPRVEAILETASHLAVDGLEAPAMVAYCRHPRAAGTSTGPALSKRATHLARMFDLPRREAELAILLADGHSLAEAAMAMNLTIETIRNYSKRLFARTGARSQADLVRIVFASCAVLA